MPQAKRAPKRRRARAPKPEPQAEAAPKAVKPPLPGQMPAASVAPVVRFIPPWRSGCPGPTAGVEEPDPSEAYDFRHVPMRTQALRRLFVAEFVKDFNGAAALGRLGFDYKEPAITANQWLREPFTQHVLERYVEETEEKGLITRNKILSGLVREANSYGLDSSGASRTSALRTLAKIMGMEIKKVEATVTATGGVMLVPVGSSPDEWEKNAAASQAALKANAKT